MCSVWRWMFRRTIHYREQVINLAPGTFVKAGHELTNPMATPCIDATYVKSPCERRTASAACTGASRGRFNPQAKLSLRWPLRPWR